MNYLQKFMLLKFNVLNFIQVIWLVGILYVKDITLLKKDTVIDVFLHILLKILEQLFLYHLETATSGIKKRKSKLVCFYSWKTKQFTRNGYSKW